MTLCDVFKLVGKELLRTLSGMQQASFLVRLVFSPVNVVHLPNILIVNDDPATLLGMCSILENAPQASQYRIFLAGSGEEALRAVLQHDFAVILLDAKMPVMDGFTTAEAIHAHPRSATVPIIFVTAYLDDEISRLKGYERGAVDFLMTPVVPKILIAKVLVFVELTRQRHALQEQSVELMHMNTELREQQRMSDERELRIRTIIENVGDGIVTMNMCGTIESFNGAASRIFGYHADEIVGQNILLLIPPHLHARHEAGMRRYARGGGSRMVGRGDIEMTGLHKNGTELPLELAVNQIQIGQRVVFVGILRDITNRKRAEAAILAEKERLRVTLNAIGDAIGDAVITADTDGHVTYLNRAAVGLTGWHNDEAIGKPLSAVFQAVNDGNGDAATDIVQLALLTQSSVTAIGNDILIQHRYGSTTPIDTSAAPITDDNGTTIGVVQVFRDVSHARQIAAELQFQASHDPLTGLFNRAEFERRLAHAVKLSNLEHKPHTLLYLDLDQFKIVNDTCGHEAGDELLRQLTEILQRELRQSDTLARLGGDEFGVLLHSCATEAGLQIADQLRRVVCDFCFSWDGKAFSVGASIGLVTFAGGVTLSDVLRMADSACYVAKDLGRNRVHVYTLEDEEIVQRQNEMGWIGRIERALEEQRFVLYAQKILALNDTAGTIQHYELLLRMRGDDGNLIAPTAFIPAAERYGLMPAIDRWVVQEACARMASLPAHRAAPVLCSINLSGSTMCDMQFSSFVREQFELHRIAPGAICFEITESAAISNLRHAAATIRELKALGCYIALDDFGKGMSSFSYLKHLAVDFLKIDGGFIKDMAHNPIDHAMVEAINNIGHVMGLRTVAEYVENDDSLAALRLLKVDFAQGYVLERPRPIHAQHPLFSTQCHANLNAPTPVANTKIHN